MKKIASLWLYDDSCKDSSNETIRQEIITTKHNIYTCFKLIFSNRWQVFK